LTRCLTPEGQERDNGAKTRSKESSSRNGLVLLSGVTTSQTSSSTEQGADLPSLFTVLELGSLQGSGQLGVLDDSCVGDQDHNEYHHGKAQKLHSCDNATATPFLVVFRVFIISSSARAPISTLISAPPRTCTTLVHRSFANLEAQSRMVSATLDPAFAWSRRRCHWLRWSAVG
jgi:hypothetical protein